MLKGLPYCERCKMLAGARCGICRSVKYVDLNTGEEEPEDEEPDWAPLCRCEMCSPGNITCVSKD